MDGCHKLKQISGIEKFNTNNVTKMNNMFSECYQLEILNLSNFNTSSVETMELMFYKCRELKVIDGIYNFNSSKVTNMRGMFQECNELEYLDLSKFNTSKVNYLNNMFAECFELQYLDISNFDTSNVINMENMFYKCYKLKELKLNHKFSITKNKIVNIKGIFEECNPNLNFNKIIDKYNEIVKKSGNDKALNIVKKEIKVNFLSTDQHINCTLSCYNTDNFTILQDKLFEKYPELKRQDNCFLVNGRIVNHLLSIEENKIKNDDHILISNID